MSTGEQGMYNPPRTWYNGKKEVADVLDMIFRTWKSMLERKYDKEKDCHFDQAAELEAAIPPRPPKEPVVIPPLQERIDSCYESLDQLQAEWAQMDEHERWFYPMQEDAELLEVTYTHNRMNRVRIYRERAYYSVHFDELNLCREELLQWIYEPGMPWGEWQTANPWSSADTLEDARRIAKTILQQLT